MRASIQFPDMYTAQRTKESRTVRQEKIICAIVQSNSAVALIIYSTGLSVHDGLSFNMGISNARS